MKVQSYYEYYSFNGADFFTLVVKPEKEGTYPVVITRSPYVGYAVNASYEELRESFEKNNAFWAENNYVLVFQHCRGQGKSTGDFVPYVHEREDGLALRDWVRRQSFYNGQIFLLGASYTASLHYSTAPFEPDVKGAVFEVQDSERYRLWYRNGQMRRGHANWHFNLYKAKSGLEKLHTMESFSELPLENLSERVLGERAEDFEKMLSAEKISSSFWNTRFGGSDARDAVKDADIPILFTTGYNDFYVGGMFKMWEEMGQETREKCAMIVSPYNHGQSYDKNNGICFPGGSIQELVGENYSVRWFDAILKDEEPFIETGKITYYRTFENKWETDFYKGATEEVAIPLGNTVKTFVYNPEKPTGFVPEGIRMNNPGESNEFISIKTEPLDKDVFVKGKMRIKLMVESDSEDTSFYVMIGINTENGDYALRHDITSLVYQKGSYSENQKVFLDFEFDEYAFKLKKGQSLRVDIASTDKNTYVCHTNKKGNYCTIESSKTANNKVYMEESFLYLPVEKEIC